ncbi:MAG: hypothetical protein IPL98_11715 [Saprospiraceae bacterium]|nr:hypothetical protein [Saprospiraceae bacterium]
MIQSTKKFNGKRKDAADELGISERTLISQNQAI